MKAISSDQLASCTGGSWREAVSCIGSATALVADVLVLGLMTATTPIGAVVLGIALFEGNGVLTGINCGKWAAS